MLKNKIIKIIASTVTLASLIMINPIGANAEWSQDNNGWRYTEGNSWATGWRTIKGTWYHFDDSGYMEANTTVDGYILNDKGQYIGKKKKKIEKLNSQIMNNMPSVDINGTSISIKTLDEWSKSSSKKDIYKEYLDKDGNVVYLRYSTHPSLADDPLVKYKAISGPGYSTSEVDVSGKVSTVLYKDKNGTILYKAQVKDNKLYYYDNNNNPIKNSIINGKITDSQGAWKIGNIRNIMIKPINKPDFNLNVYPEQMDEIYLDVENSTWTPENITFTIWNNVSDINNNVGQIKFRDGFETYRLSDDGSSWIDATESLDTSSDNYSQPKEYTLGYRNSYSFWFDKNSPLYQKVFNKPGKYLVVSDGLELATIINVKW